MAKVTKLERPRLHVTSVEVRDVLGARSFAMEPGKITALTGRNGTGKSTALQALQAALGGGNLSRLARVDASGAEVEPEVVLVLSAERGPEQYRVERTGATVRVRARVGESVAFEDVRRPQEWLTSIFDPHGANPVAFLQAKDKDRALLLLEALPLKLDRAELVAILGPAAAHVTGAEMLARLHPLEELAGIRLALFNARTGVNRDAKNAEAAADQLKRNTPAVLPTKPGEDLGALEERRSKLSAACAAEALRIRTESDRGCEKAASGARTEEETVKAEFARRAAALRAEHARKVAELEEALAVEIQKLRDVDEQRLDAIGEARDRATRAALADAVLDREKLATQERDLATLAERIGELRAQSAAASKAHALSEQAQQFETDAVRLQEQGEDLTQRINALDAFTRRLAEDLPIPGLEIRDKSIFVGGVPFDQLNTQQRVDIAVRVAVLRAADSRLPVVFVDGAEALDSEHFRALVERLDREQVQAFLARVTDEAGLHHVDGAEIVAARA